MTSSLAPVGLKYPFVATCILSAALLIGAVKSGDLGTSETTGKPVLLDERLELSLFAEDPDIVTPIGLAIDDRSRVYVLESHTHSPPSGYEGPDTDVVKVFSDTNGDGAADSVHVYADGIEDGMNLAFSPNGDLVVVAAKAVWVFSDRDGDGISDDRRKVLDLVEPPSVYDHAALLSVAISGDGWMYVGRGNVGGSAWRLEGTDGSTVSGYGDGGNVVRARLDGSELSEVATGFWNPFSLAFDASGRLFALDNDPDSRGPNRLVHVIPGGDYGYMALYGNSGIHPYLAWNGELPGTLPYAAGVGEAPAGLFLADQAALPVDYRGQFLAAIWEERSVVRLRLSPRGASVSGEARPIIESSERFRPVAFAAAPDGAIYMTDWVLRQYPNHGRGRIWKIAAKPGIETMRPGPLNSGVVQDITHGLGDVYAARSRGDLGELQEALGSQDPFVTSAAISALAHPDFEADLLTLTTDRDADVRLGALLALQKMGYGDPEPVVRRLLGDSDTRVRRMALRWIGRKGMTYLRSEIDRALEDVEVTTELFETYLATVRHLQPEYIEARRSQDTGAVRRLSEDLPESFIARFIADASRAQELRAVAVPYLERPQEVEDLLLRLLDQSELPAFTIELLRSLRHVPSVGVGQRLLSIAEEQDQPREIRAEALLALEAQPIDAASRVAELLQDADPHVQVEAARYLRSHASDPGVGDAMRSLYQRLAEEGDDGPLFQQLAAALQGDESLTPHSLRPQSVPEWKEALARGGDPVRGRRAYFSARAMCAQCHTIEGRGGDIGPDLTNVGLSKTRAQLVESILEPSSQVSPEWQGWYIQLKSGEMIYGRQIDVGGSQVEIYTQSGGFVAFDLDDVEDYGVLDTSLMPSGLEAALTLSDLQDIVSFLTNARYR